MPDIDIDINHKFRASPHWIRASINTDGILTKHNSGYYVHSNIPNIYPNLHMSVISYDTLDNLDINKIDFLKNNFYDNFKFRFEIDEICKENVPWENLQSKDIVNKLSHINNYFDLLQRFKINSLPDLADFLSIIRPGKSHLIESYLSSEELKQKIRNTMLYKHTDGYYYKKSHAYAYAKLVSIQLVYYSK